MISKNLLRLESESIYIFRELVAEFSNPVLLYTGGKDSATMLHIAMKAFLPGRLPFPLLHVDSTWEFREMYSMRSQVAQRFGLDLLTYRNPDAERLGVNPFDYDAGTHAAMWNTMALRQAIEKYKFDVAIGGARRDEEKSRAKERIFSVRNAQHNWDPKSQRPELWELYNTRLKAGETMRVFPLSNWTELDIWQYIFQENVPLVSLYLARQRPVVERQGRLIMVDDERFRLMPGEVPGSRLVRFRTLGCYPLTAAIESAATTLPKVILELATSRFSERQGRIIDHDKNASMEEKKREGYF